MDATARRLLDTFDAALRVEASYYAYAEMLPQSKQSTSFGRRGKSKRRQAFTSGKKRDYMYVLAAKLGASWTARTRLAGNLRLTALFSFPFRKQDEAVRQLGWALMNKRPDVDNLTKPLLDCLQKHCLHDDSYVVEFRGRKIRSERSFLALRVDRVNADHDATQRPNPAT